MHEPARREQVLNALSKQPTILLAGAAGTEKLTARILAADQGGMVAGSGTVVLEIAAKRGWSLAETKAFAWRIGTPTSKSVPRRCPPRTW